LVFELQIIQSNSTLFARIVYSSGEVGMKLVGYYLSFDIEDNNYLINISECLKNSKKNLIY
jgi:hypothetical protein